MICDLKNTRARSRQTNFVQNLVNLPLWTSPPFKDNLVQ